MWFGDFALDPIRGAIVANELKRREQELFDADRAEAKPAWAAIPGYASCAAPPPSAEPTQW